MTANAIDRATLDRLTALGRSRGGLTTADLRAALPVEAMEPEDIALVVASLEDRGIPVELEDELLGGPPRDPSPRPAPDLLQADGAVPPAAMRNPGERLEHVPGPPPAAPREPTVPRAVHGAVLLAGALVLALLSAGIALLARS